MNLAEQHEKVPHLSDKPITFIEEEAHGLWHPHNGAIVVNLKISRRNCILIDNGSSFNILFKSTLNRMDLVGEMMELTNSAISDFTGKL